jgi:hypothetical protein
MLITQWLTCMATGDAALYLPNTLLEMDSFAEHFSALDDNFSRFIQSHSTTFTHLPHEAHQHVLSFLPAKAALRMQRVNRTWRYHSMSMLNQPLNRRLGQEASAGKITRFFTGTLSREDFTGRLDATLNNHTNIHLQLDRIPHDKRQERLPITLDLMRNKTHFLTLDLRAPDMPDEIAQVLDALRTICANNNSLRSVSLDLFSKLDVSGTGLGVQAFVTLLQNQDLTSLNFGSNSVGEDDLQQVVAALHENQSLTSLNLSNNYLDDESIRTLGTTVGIVRPDLELIL